MKYNMKKKRKTKKQYTLLWSALQYSLDFSFFVLNILADYISVSGDSTLTAATSRIFVHGFWSYFL